MKKYELVINNGLVINSDNSVNANIGIRDGRIATITNDKINADREINAAGKWVIPGVIDPHVHFALKQGQGDDATQTEDDYESGPRAAAVGGVTTFIDFAISPSNQSPIDYLKQRMEMAATGSCIDYSFHAGITNSDPAVINMFKTIVEMGIPSFKFFVNYKKWGFAVDLGFLMDAMKELRDLGGVACLHAEDDEIIEYLRSKHANEPGLIYHSLTRPVLAEEIAIKDVVTIAKATGAHLYIVHLTTSNGLMVIKEAQAQGISVKTETCPHYLKFTDEIYNEPLGILYTMTPPLRPPGHKESLWNGLKDGSINIVSSDHNALSGALKRSNPHWSEVPPGLAGTETLLTFLHSEGVATGQIKPERMVELLSTNPARLFGVPNKGMIKIGYDADLVIFDPTESRTVHYEDLATPTDFTIFEGMEMIGWPTHTISRGNVIVENGDFIGKKSHGRFIKRDIDFERNW